MALYSRYIAYYAYVVVAFGILLGFFRSYFSFNIRRIIFGLNFCILSIEYLLLIVRNQYKSFPPISEFSSPLLILKYWLCKYVDISYCTHAGFFLTYSIVYRITHIIRWLHRELYRKEGGEIILSIYTLRTERFPAFWQ